MISALQLRNVAFRLSLQAMAIFWGAMMTTHAKCSKAAEDEETLLTDG